ncbi:MAG: hypothetical protein NPIRA01_31510 [Nitrospirales bacterium]|nr:MAG: hypothetical protein NPIRA01_31510 [Nitrospirales bacterium]
MQAQELPIIHSTELTTAKVHDVQMLKELQHGDEQALFGDSAYPKQADKHQASSIKLLLSRS